MKNQRYTLDNFQIDFAMDVVVDHDVLTQELATDLLMFWSGGAHWIQDCDGDAVAALLRRLATTAFCMSIRGDLLNDAEGVTRALAGEEGWGDIRRSGITITRFAGELEVFDDDVVITHRSTEVTP